MLPGNITFNEELTKKLNEHKKKLKSSYKPGTRHLLENGEPEFTNRLLLESSPYLEQHAHNPVNWYPWGEEAFEAAKKLNRPMLLSIGYSTCHWCHIMEEESFEDIEIAGYINENYIAIKIDREERPDLDSIFMAAVTEMTGGGGWPLTVWLTPEGNPFYGGTYFPARDGDRGAPTGFLTILKKIIEFYKSDPGQISEMEHLLTQAINVRLTPMGGTAVPGEEILHNAFQYCLHIYDPAFGGVRGSPKFPSSLPIRFLLRYYNRTKNKDALDMAESTLIKMASGGIYDHIGGGFHRYSTDERWLVPHFEKMLYDNALLILSYLEAYQATGNKKFKHILHETLKYIEREMISPEGGFYSATDADSINNKGEKEEGWHFTWTPGEIDRALPAGKAEKIKKYYDITTAGNFESRNVLSVQRSIDDIAREFGMDGKDFQIEIDESREILYSERIKRTAPFRDEKIITAWNGLMISAFARSGMILNEKKYINLAAGAAEFILENLFKEKTLLRSYKDGYSANNAFLEDYAFFTASLLDLYESTGENKWLKNAVELDKAQYSLFYDSSLGGYFRTEKEHNRIITREKPYYDGAEPSGNSITLMNLLRLYYITAEEKYIKTAEASFRYFSKFLMETPLALTEMLLALDFKTGDPKEIVVVTGESLTDAEPFLEKMRSMFIPNHVLMLASDKDIEIHAELAPVMKSKKALGKMATAYVCRHGTCGLPTTDPEEFSRQL